MMRPLAALFATVAAVVAAGACSLTNQEGPLVTCSMLECGRINACQEGIIAQCVDGETVKYRVCAVTDICAAEWQKPGQYRCEAEDTDCQGCRPERELGCDDPSSTRAAEARAAQAVVAARAAQAARAGAERPRGPPRNRVKRRSPARASARTSSSFS
ncbi:MAG: hypothetical protein IPM79_00645 [Polyangiaceae bacterium]|nr:hypothetical protein [Polyangiaceae bacterium]